MTVAVGFSLVVLVSACDRGREEGQAVGKLPKRQVSVLFQSYCSACHQMDGRGREGGGPPLDGSPWVTGSEQRLVRIVLHGVHGPIEVGDVTYRREMPGFGQVLDDAQIADLLSEVRRRFGQPSPPISTETVAKIRAATPDRIDYWTVEELIALP